jgi:phosphatidylserine/phosphatidylglycerophosphate/cardiolipin synthase-like enzyme
MHPIVRSRHTTPRTLWMPLAAICLSVIAVGSIVALDASLPAQMLDRGQRGSTLERSQPEIHFAPYENLEDVDIPLINGASEAVDVAMYTFTDQQIAYALVRAARRGVRVRIYRDREQFQSEQERGGQVSAILAGQPNIQIRVKASRDLMHDKFFVVDGHILRNGSGNWSVSAARYQDNEITVIRQPLEVNPFARDFYAMWTRRDNEVIQ